MVSEVSFADAKRRSKGVQRTRLSEQSAIKLLGGVNSPSRGKISAVLTGLG